MKFGIGYLWNMRPDWATRFSGNIMLYPFD
jgi:hypothetical protein